VHGAREVVYRRLLPSQIKDTDLTIWDTTIEARLWVRLNNIILSAVLHCAKASARVSSDLVFAIPVASSRSARHFRGLNEKTVR
jgi:hypothetical protein